MPPKKRSKKSAPATKAEQPTMWLVTLSDNDGYGAAQTTEQALYDSLDKAISGGVNLMDVHSPWANDWRNGLEGLEQEEEDNYIGFEYTPKLGARGGVLISNEESDMSQKVSVSIKRMEVNPPEINQVQDRENKRREAEEVTMSSFFG